MTRRGVVTLCVLGALLGACRGRPAPVPVKARFGVFFGGQVQERDEVPLVLDRSRLALGLRIEWSTPPATAERVHWELQQPASAGDTDAGGLVSYGDADGRPGETLLDVPLAFRASDRPGAWRVRVSVAGQPVLERGFRVVPPAPGPAPLRED